ncbi:MAG: hypothetical protein IAE63_04290 [Alphaproteobacteria bacterium]|nr:hypothetical protein [Alphaproteobacteria bacterium]
MMSEQVISEIQNRNRRVEMNKAWETSKTRRGIIAGITYIVAGIYMSSLGVGNPWMNALIPTGGYVFSTLSLPMAKKLWLEKFYSEKDAV